MRLADFDYHLPPDRIAQSLARPRDASRLMVLDRRTGALSHRVFRDLPDLLSPGDLLVLNDTRVLPARLRGVRDPGGGQVEVLVLRGAGEASWLAMVRPSRRLREGVRLRLAGGLTATVTTRRGGGVWLLEVHGNAALPEVLRRRGQMPLPPYIRRAPQDPEAYQTVYARVEGAVAAPTAGLHFTPELLDRLSARGIDRAFLTLHVGPGTFRPVRSQDPSRHQMEAEYYEIPSETAAAIRCARQAGRRVVAVGTTVVRTLETAATEERTVEAGRGWTELFILPGHRFRVVDALITNFHLPRTTLLMLVCAFADRQTVLAAYREAVERGYRFYSFGDAMLIR
ncbi:MAG: tRNA preQ1(34) S-adenosylmethionine ribosyltransferase-isomerase QueA [Armatimonadota bacterium]|nr:tRNA preQ1(34) S-adenosylmethionine ribosyltransferase-isomerase QueA [Armatimonadota bacterium]MDR5697710.1 tRNA preQ1(34) S-adenosylmethionine ribosyltransferase-isomerase QueA [Armatimonadota bacterium]